ncbi:hypothetical protein B0H11DRAFT_1908023 [Mycena galericulata]|nr:hypothetical protein B0H11DRAFT_1908023 [Mycena galericulata]
MPVFKDILHSAVPALSLSLLSVLPSLDLLEAILRDDALDNLPDEDISDAEEYAPQPIVAVEHRAHPEIVASTTLHIGCTPDTVLNWIACDRVSFPPLIEVLRFQVQEEQVTVQPRVISHADQHRVIAALSHGYPHLREVQIGYPSNLWKRDALLTADALPAPAPDFTDHIMSCLPDSDDSDEIRDPTFHLLLIVASEPSKAPTVQ